MYNVERGRNETVENNIDKSLNIIRDANVDIPPQVADPAHRVGQ